MGSFRVIYRSAPAYDGHEPEADPVCALLADMENMRPLADPYPRRDAHGGPDDAWHPPKRATSEWKTVGRRSAHALLDDGQDIHDDVDLVKAEKKAWASIRKRFDRWATPSLGDAPVVGNPFKIANHPTDLLVDDRGDLVLDDDEKLVPVSQSWDWARPPALYRWLSVDTPVGSFRVIYRSAPAYDGHEPEADPVCALLADMENMRPLADPYPRRDAHGGPDDAWHPPKRATSEWKTVGRRSAHALLDDGQDIHDDLAATANGVTTWRATQAEMAARNPEGILQTRHFRASPEQPRDHLITLFDSIGFDIFPGAREWALGEDATADATPERVPVYTATTEAGWLAWEKRQADKARGGNHG